MCQLYGVFNKKRDALLFDTYKMVKIYCRHYITQDYILPEQFLRKTGHVDTNAILLIIL